MKTLSWMSLKPWSIVVNHVTLSYWSSGKCMPEAAQGKQRKLSLWISLSLAACSWTSSALALCAKDVLPVPAASIGRMAESGSQQISSMGCSSECVWQPVMPSFEKRPTRPAQPTNATLSAINGNNPWLQWLCHVQHRMFSGVKLKTCIYVVSHVCVCASVYTHKNPNRFEIAGGLACVCSACLSKPYNQVARKRHQFWTCVGAEIALGSLPSCFYCFNLSPRGFHGFYGCKSQPWELKWLKWKVAQSGCQAQGRKLLQNVNSKKSEDGPSRRFAMSLIRAKKVRYGKGLGVAAACKLRRCWRTR